MAIQNCSDFFLLFFVLEHRLGFPFSFTFNKGGDVCVWCVRVRTRMCVCVCVGGGEGGSLGGQNLVWGQLMNRGKANF